MNELAELTIKAHGGLKRWGQLESVSAHLDQGGALWALKGQAGTLDHTNVTAGLRSEWASTHPSAHQAQGPDSNPTESRWRVLRATSWRNCWNLARPSPVIRLKPPGAHCSWLNL